MATLLAMLAALLLLVLPSADALYVWNTKRVLYHVTGSFGGKICRQQFTEGFSACCRHLSCFLLSSVLLVAYLDALLCSSTLRYQRTAEAAEPAAAVRAAVAQTEPDRLARSRAERQLQLLRCKAARVLARGANHVLMDRRGRCLRKHPARAL